MTGLNQLSLSAFSDEQLCDLLCNTLAEILPVKSSPEFLPRLRKLPLGLRIMASTYDLDVSLALDDFGWHFGNNHSKELAEETAFGLDELGATELAFLFREAFLHAQRFWEELGKENWHEWYSDSELDEILLPLNKRAWSILESKKDGIFEYWINYARKYPEYLRC